MALTPAFIGETVGTGAPCAVVVHVGSICAPLMRLLARALLGSPIRS